MPINDIDDAEAIVSVRGVSKRFRLYRSARHRLFGLLFGMRSYREHWALRDVDFTARRGETIGLIGRNGAGKSTLLSVIAGTSGPTGGAVSVHGRIAALLELGAGFHPDWTGRQNVEFHVRLLGVPEVKRLAWLAQVEAFADIGSYYDQPLRMCSSGMAVRVAFAAAAFVEPDVLIVDEALAVGDASFQHKCFRRLHELKASGVTILFVTHRLDLITQLCDRAVLLERGRVAFDGDPGTAVARYGELVYKTEQRPTLDLTGERIGVGGARIVDIVAERAGSLGYNSDEIAAFLVRIAFDRAVEHPIFGFALKSVEDVVLYGTSSDSLGLTLAPVASGDTLTLRIAVPLTFPVSSVFADFSVCTFEDGETQILEAHRAALRLDIVQAEPFFGVVNLRATVQEVSREPATQ